MNKRRVEEALAAAKQLNDMFDDNRATVIQLLEEALKPEPQFYIGQPVLVKAETKKSKWHQGFIDSKDGGGLLVKFGRDYTSFHAKNIKLDLDAETLPNWIEVDKSEWATSIKYSDKEMCIAIYRDGKQFLVDPKSHALYLKGVVRYCVIPLPQFVGKE